MNTDYEQVASTYARRYALNTYGDLERTLVQFVGGAGTPLLEVGCGTGHWLSLLTGLGVRASGVDPSRAMLECARLTLPEVPLARARAEALPFANAVFNRAIIINALHHFVDPARAIGECARVLRPGGALLVVGLDPSQGRDRWCIYDFFPGTHTRDLERYPTTTQIAAWMSAAGLTDTQTQVAQRIAQSFPAKAALAAGRLSKNSTSQLSELTDKAYQQGIASIEHANTLAEARGGALTLNSDLHLMSTSGRRS
jgi:ubiquinone/menaquinone biosynthesis C-methylase UbiE